MLTDLIVCLIGESGSGKTTIAQELEKQGCNIIHSYTTRPPRSFNEWGHTFVNLADICIENDVINNTNVIAYTQYNGNYYWATHDQYLNKGISIYVIDPYGYQVLKKRITKAKVFGVYISVDEQIRFKRLNNRDGFGKAKERMEHDAVTFSSFGTDWVINAQDYSAHALALDILNAAKPS